MITINIIWAVCVQLIFHVNVICVLRRMLLIFSFKDTKQWNGSRYFHWRSKMEKLCGSDWLLVFSFVNITQCNSLKRYIRWFNMKILSIDERWHLCETLLCDKYHYYTIVTWIMRLLMSLLDECIFCGED
jgi:hypothetical protein